MKKLNKIKYFLAAMLLYKSGAFGANDTTKQLINKYLAKYGITSNKQDCNTGKEPEYIENTGKVKCKNDKQDDTNNCWDADSRLCKECPDKMVVSQKDHTTCRQIVCPEGYELIEIQNNECPEGYEIKEFNKNCDAETYIFDEVAATKNYTTQSINCKNIKVN